MIQPQFLFFRLLRFVSDCVLVPMIFVIAYTLKFKIGGLIHPFFSHGTVYQHAQIEPYLNVMGLILLIWIPIFYISGMYRPFVGLMPEVDELLAIAKGVTIATLMTMAITFVFKSFPESRYVVFYAWLVGGILITTLHLGIRSLELRAIKSGKGLRTIVMGSGPLAQDIVEKIILYPSLGYSYVGSIATTPPSILHYHLQNTFRYLGPPSAYKQLLQTTQPHIVLLTDNEISEKTLADYANYGVSIKKISQDAQWTQSFATTEDFDGIPLIRYDLAPPPFIQRTAKIFLDYTVSTLLLIILSPVLFLIGVLIKIVSPTGPILYKQERVGHLGKPFWMFKFRTMVPEAETNSGPVMARKKDTRYIPFGHLLRKTSLDELPQLINILKGEMSLVGPRPERPFFVENFSQTLPHFRLRHVVKGGLTGWAQVNGRAVLSTRPEHKIRYDLYYIKNWSFLLDIKILIRTVVIVLRSEEAY